MVRTDYRLSSSIRLFHAFCPIVFCYDDMDAIGGLTVNRYDSSDPSTPISPDKPWKSRGKNGPSLIIAFSTATQINQLEFNTKSGRKVKVFVQVSSDPNGASFDRDLFAGKPVSVKSGERLNIPSPPVVTNVYAIKITFRTRETQTVKVFGCTVQGETPKKTSPLFLAMWYLNTLKMCFGFATSFVFNYYYRNSKGLQRE